MFFSRYAGFCRCLFLAVYITILAAVSAQTFAQGANSIFVSELAVKPLSLSQAITYTLEQNPQLHQFTIRQSGLLGRRETDELSPAWNLAIDVENMAGSDALSGVQMAETTVSLSSVIELGGKRDARVSVVDAQLDALDYHRHAFTLDVLGELTSTFIRVLETQELIKLAKEALDLAKNTLDIVKKRSHQGATPEYEVKRAASALAQAQLHLNGLQYQHKRLMVKLTSYWGERSPTWNSVVGDLYYFGESSVYDTLYERAKTSPGIAYLASKDRLKKAEVLLAKTQAASDIGWQLGVRRFEETGEVAFAAGVTIPLFKSKRNRGAVATAMALQHEIEYEKQTALLQLHVQLFTAYSQREQYVAAVNVFRSTVLPDLQSVLVSTQRAYETGRYRYQDWIAAQNELLDARQYYIENAAAASLNQAIIEQLIAEPLNRSIR